MQQVSAAELRERQSWALQELCSAPVFVLELNQPAVCAPAAAQLIPH